MFGTIVAIWVWIFCWKIFITNSIYLITIRIFRCFIFVFINWVAFNSLRICTLLLCFWVDCHKKLFIIFSYCYYFNVCRICSDSFHSGIGIFLLSLSQFLSLSLFLSLCFSLSCVHTSSILFWGSLIIILNFQKQSFIFPLLLISFQYFINFSLRNTFPASSYI